MRRVISFCVIAVSILCSIDAQSQTSSELASQINQDSVLRARADSIQRKWMKDSLGVSDQTVTSVFSARDTGFARMERIIIDQSLTPGQRSMAIQGLRSTTDEAIKNALGETAYVKYLDLIIGRKPE